MNIKQCLTFILSCCLLVSASSWAISIKDAKDQGLVGENAQGYIEAVKDANTEVKALIVEVNGKRKVNYGKIAKKQGLTLQQIEQVAGERNFKKTQAGHYIKQGDAWKKK